MKILVTGATGTVGSEVVRQAILDDSITEITALVRRPLSFSHQKLKVVLHYDFTDYSAFREIFAEQDAILWCLGISQSLVTEEEYIKITYDYAIAAAKELYRVNPEIPFMFLSGDGAASDEQSRFLFGRVKGKTENDLQKIGLKYFYIARPGGILPSTKDPNINFYLKLQNAIIAIMAFIVPPLVITSANLAKVLIKITKEKGSKVLYTHKDLKGLEV